LRHRGVVRLPNSRLHLRLAEPEDDAHALRSREGQIETGDPCPARSVTQRSAKPRLLAGEHAPQVLPVDRAVQAEPPRCRAEPLAASVGTAGVLVLDAVADALNDVDPPLRLVEVVASLARGELSNREQLFRLRCLSRCRTSAVHLPCTPASC
jgi:hypothetical protein